MDERADEGQREALQMIFGGQAGGWPARLSAIFGPEMLGLEFAPIEVEIAPDQTSWHVVIPGLVRATAKALSGPTSEGKPPRNGEPPRVRDGTRTGRHSGQGNGGQYKVRQPRPFASTPGRQARSSCGRGIIPALQGVGQKRRQAPIVCRDHGFASKDGRKPYSGADRPARSFSG
jgi:hypothetical protein